jgi:hypothetical protein
MNCEVQCLSMIMAHSENFFRVNLDQKVRLDEEARHTLDCNEARQEIEEYGRQCVCDGTAVEKEYE